MHRELKVMLLIDSARAYERALLSGIARYSQLHGPWIFFHKPPFWETRPRKSLLAELGTVDGIILIESSYLPEILKLCVPVIVSNYATERIDGLPNIVSDHRAIGRMVADHLIERGFRHFAFCGDGDYFWSNQRCEGFQQRVQEAGSKVHCFEPASIPKDLLWKKEQQFLMAWLRSLPQPVGLMACIDERSRQIAEACKAAALSVPDQVAILGVDNDEIIYNLSNIPLSSVALTAEQGGYEAAELLDKLMQGRRNTKDLIEIKPSHVVTRASTDVLAIEDPQVSRAAKFISDHCRHTIYVADVAKAAGLSRRVLEKRFRTALARSINGHIRQCRVQHILKMLTYSEMTILEIALTMGFSDAAHIARYFRSQTGMSLAEYRRQHCPKYHRHLRGAPGHS
jgi:LacI family transcriptional regulator